MSNFSSLQGDYVWAYDLETAGNANASKFHAKFDADIKAPKTWKDEEKIAAYIKEATIKAGEKDALHWTTGRVVSFSMVNVGDVMKQVKKPRSFTFCGYDEKKVLLAAHNVISTEENGVFQLVGKSSDGFDNGFFIGRCLANSVPVPTIMKDSFNLLDVDKMIAGYKGGQSSTLNKYLFALGIDAKIMSGGMVPTMFKQALGYKIAGKDAEAKAIMLKIKNYNYDDALKTAMIAARLLAV